MATTTRIVIQQAVDLDTNNITAGKYPRFVVSLGFSVTGVTINDLTNAIQETANNAAVAATSAAAAKASQDAAKVSETNAKASETAAKTSETNAKTSETNAKASETAAAASQTAAATSATNAKTSETNAKTSETNAKASETAALASKNAAKTSETNAKTSEINAATSETNALASKNAAAASQTAAKTSETNAKTSETNAKASELAAAASQTNAATSETNAATSETNALASKNAAKTSETNAKTSETNALASKNEAKTSETNALASKNAAAASQTAAKTSETNAKTSETNALASKNAAADSQTAAAGSAAAALDSKNAAAASQTAAKTSETNAKTSETNAKTSETAAAASQTAAAGSEAAALDSKNAAAASQTAAKTSETNALASKNAAAASATNAATSETNALASKNAAKTSETNAKTSETAAKTSETNAKTSEIAAATSATNAATSETNALASKNAAAASQTAAKTSETNALASKNEAKTSETNAKTSETNAKASEIAAATSAASIVTYEPAPYPDVWVPLTDDMRLLSGMATYDLATINGVILELPTKSANFTRSTIASYIAKSGKMIFADINEPRFEKQGLLMESQCTNLYPNSETIVGGSLVITTPNASACPTDEVLMTKFTENTNNGEHYCNDKGIALTAGTFYCYSAYVKDDTANRLVYLRVASGSTVGMFFDIKNETVTAGGTASNIRGGYERLTGGIYRIWVSFAATATQNTIFRLQMTQPGTNSVYQGDGVSGFYIWGIQVEEGIAPTSYIRNSTNTTTTRTADEWWCIPDNAGYRTLADYFERTVSFEFNCKVRPYTSYAEVMQVRGPSNDIICRLNSNDNATLITYRSSGGPTLAIPDIESLPPMTYAQKITGNEISNFFNGKTAKSTSTPVSLTGIPSRLGPPSPYTAAKFVYHIKNFRVWHKSLNNNQITSLR